MSHIPDMPIWLGIIACIMLSALFSGLNLAVFSVSQLRLQIEADGGNRDATRVLDLRKNSNQVLAQRAHALLSANRLLEKIPNEDAKTYLTSQVVDETRHCNRLHSLHERKNTCAIPSFVVIRNGLKRCTKRLSTRACPISNFTSMLVWSGKNLVLSLGGKGAIERDGVKLNKGP
jgi:hypothetical protein